MSRKYQRLGRRFGALITLTALALMLAPPVHAAVPFKDAAFSGYATGTYLHADALSLVAGPNTLKVDAGFGAAAVNSRGLTAVTDELGREVSPALAGKNSYGAGFGLDANLLNSELLEQQQAAAAAPPSTDLIVKRLGPITVPGVASAGALEGRAQARYDANTCILGEDMSYGQGDVADLTLLGDEIADLPTEIVEALIGTNPSNQDPGAVRTSSRTRLVPQTNEAGQKIGDNVGLMSETKQTLAPVVLFQGIPGAELTINLLGEWTLRAVATGIPGQAYIQYMPPEGQTPVLTVQNTLPAEEGQTPLPAVGVTLDQLLGIAPLDDLLSGDVLNLGLVELELNPDPTIVENPDGTSASASVDVVRVTLLPGAEGVLEGLLGDLLGDDAEDPDVALSLADVRIGHMEVAATVPPDGIKCPDIEVTKTASPDPVNAGNDFIYTINIVNPYDCTLTDVKVVDTITATRGVKFNIRSQDPAASSVSNNVITWNDVGPIPPRGSKQLRITVNIPADSAAGNLINTAVVNSNCGLDTAQGGGKINLGLSGGVRVEIPRVQAQVAPPLPRTGGENLLFVASAVGLTLLSLLSAAGYRRLRVRAENAP